MAWLALAPRLLVVWLLGLPALCIALQLAGFAMPNRHAALPALALSLLLALPCLPAAGHVVLESHVACLASARLPLRLPSPCTVLRLAVAAVLDRYAALLALAQQASFASLHAAALLLGSCLQAIGTCTLAFGCAVLAYYVAYPALATQLPLAHLCPHAAGCLRLEVYAACPALAAQPWLTCLLPFAAALWPSSLALA